jgi:2-succinyl-6-hydroxy-2,4-cyclohexadiene-1-carboxylate synthase
MVLVHGFTGSAAYWMDDLLMRLEGGGREVVRVELPGHEGRSGGAGRADVTLEGALARIADVAHDAFDLVGYSMGGRIALHFAVAVPGRVRRLVLESASPGLALESDRVARRIRDEALASRIEADGVPAFVEAWSRLPILRPAAARPSAVEDHVRNVRLAHRAEGLAAALRGLGTGALPALWGRLAEVPAPTLVMAGAEDEKFTDVARRMALELPDATLEVVPGAGHTVHLDRPDAWAAAVREHLAAG